MGMEWLLVLAGCIMASAVDVYIAVFTSLLKEA